MSIVKENTDNRIGIIKGCIGTFRDMEGLTVGEIYSLLFSGDK